MKSIKCRTDLLFITAGGDVVRAHRWAQWPRPLQGLWQWPTSCKAQCQPCIAFPSFQRCAKLNYESKSFTPLISKFCKTKMHIKVFLRALLVSALPALTALLCTSCTTSHQVVEYTWYLYKVSWPLRRRLCKKSSNIMQKSSVKLLVFVFEEELLNFQSQSIKCTTSHQDTTIFLPITSKEQVIL